MPGRQAADIHWHHKARSRVCGGHRMITLCFGFARTLHLVPAAAILRNGFSETCNMSRSVEQMALLQVLGGGAPLLLAELLRTCQVLGTLFLPVLGPGDIPSDLQLLGGQVYMAVEGSGGYLGTW